MKTDILIAHPGKHHALHLVAGCIKSGASVRYITPFYHCGLGRLVSALPGEIGDKAVGYYHPAIPLQSVISPIFWQIKKLFSIYKKDLSYEQEFDNYVAHAIETGKLQAKVVVTLQDYMPNTVKAASKRRYVIWSDQISNQSARMMERVSRHEQVFGMPSITQHSDHRNDAILASSQVITVPSSYCLAGIKSRIPLGVQVETVPYGADAAQFSIKPYADPQRLIILARAQSVRKGGHLLLNALAQCSTALLALCAPKKIEVVIMGELEPALQNRLSDVALPKGLTVVHGNIAHSKIAQLYQKASLFVMPSLSEGHSLACIEAMHAGLPLIITPYCGVDDFKHAHMGYEISDTAESLAAALVEAFKNRQLWPQWGVNAKLLASHLTWLEYERRISKLAREIAC